jgi:hypothetical protein
MNVRENYTPGPATGAQVRKDGEKWTLILVREFRHPPEMVWEALTTEYAQQFGVKAPNWPPKAD